MTTGGIQLTLPLKYIRFLDGGSKLLTVSYTVAVVEAVALGSVDLYGN